MATGSKSGKSKNKKTKSAASILEELDRPIYEQKWQDLNVLLKKMSKKTAIPELITHFLTAIKQMDAMACGLAVAKVSDIQGLLQTALSACQPGKDELIRVMLQVKKAQLQWFENELSSARKELPPLSSLTRATAPMHTTKVLMEGNMYLALCNEALGMLEHHFKETLTAYEESLRLAINILVASKRSNLAVHPAVYCTIRTALERGPVLALSYGEIPQAIAFFRQVLQAKEDYLLPQIRQICTTGLACTLLFLTSKSSYKHMKTSATYTPASVIEESTLSASIAKTFLGSISDTKVEDVTTVHDLLTLALSTSKQQGLLVQNLEDSIQFSSSASHIWLQFALALVSSHQYAQAEAVFHECVKIFPSDFSVVLMASSTVLDSLDKPELAVKWLSGLLDQKMLAGHYLEPKVWFTLGKAQYALGEKELTFDKRQEIHKKGLGFFEQATKLDPQNTEFVFHLAAHLAIVRNLKAAKTEVQRALSLMSTHTKSLHLLALLFSADKQHAEAVKVCDLALKQDPDNLNILRAKIQLQLIVSGVRGALQSCKMALTVWQRLYGSDNSSLISTVTQDQQSLSDFPLPDRLDVSHNVSPDLASDAGSSHFSSNLYQSISLPSVLQAQIWCTVAEIFMEGKKLSDAASCIREAQSLSAYLPVVSITHGKLLERENQPELALTQYTDALVLQPSNHVALTHMGRLLHLSGNNEQAEKYLREAISVDGLSHEAWFWLGKVFSSQEEHEHAADCFRTSLQLESTAPVQSFASTLH